MPSVGVGAGIGKTSLGTKVNLIIPLEFTCAENQTAVGTILEPLATSFTVQEGAEFFAIANSGNITLLTASNYDTQRKYALKAISNKAKRYLITVYVTIFGIGYLWTGTEKIY